MLRGKKVVLRPVRRTDIQYFLKWFNDPEITQYIGDYLPFMEMAEEKFMQDLGADRTKAMFIIEAIENDSSKIIGATLLDGIHPKDHNAAFSIIIGDKDYWSKGFGTEAARLVINYGFEQLNLHRINSGALAFNERSLKMQSVLGFKEEGRQREWAFKNGKYQDHVVTGMLREEWKGLS